MSVSFVYVCKYLQRTVPGLVAEFFELVKGAGRGHNAGRGEPGSPAARGVETAASWASCGFDRGAGCGTNYSQQSTIFSTKIVRCPFFCTASRAGWGCGADSAPPPVIARAPRHHASRTAPEGSADRARPTHLCGTPRKAGEARIANLGLPVSVAQPRLA